MFIGFKFNRPRYKIVTNQIRFVCGRDDKVDVMNEVSSKCHRDTIHNESALQ